MARASDEEFAEALSSIDMESWLDREGVRYKITRGSSGRQANIKECPCCGNSNWKVYIGLESGLGNCFVCEEKFNRWKFISKTLNVPNRAVVEHIKQVAKEFGWMAKRLTSRATNVEKAKLLLPTSIELPYKGKNLKYLDNRGITSDLAAYFGFRFCLKGKFEFMGENGRILSQDYSNRVIIPVFDLAGELVSFQGRDITGEAEKKYLFPPGFSSTGSELYNGLNAVGSERIVIGEGVFDVAATKIALDGEQSLRDVTPIGSFGKHLSHGDERSQMNKLLELKSKGLRQVTLMWDAEKEAIKAAVKAARMIRSYGLLARVAILPKGKDPNEVPASEVRAAFWKATVIDDMSATKLLMLAESY